LEFNCSKHAHVWFITSVNQVHIPENICRVNVVVDCSKRILLLDIDECTDVTLPHMCDNGDCVNTEGSYTCDCDPGWDGDLCDIGKYFKPILLLCIRYPNKIVGIGLL